MPCSIRSAARSHRAPPAHAAPPRQSALLLVPDAGAPVERRHLAGGRAAVSSGAQHLREEVMIAIPVAFIVQRHQKQIGALELVEDELAVAL